MTEYPLDRTYLESQKIDWLPASTRRLRWIVPVATAGVIPSALAVVAVALGGPAVAILVAGYAGPASIVLGGTAGPKWARRLMMGQLSRIAHGQANLTSLQRKADGELVHVRGRVDADATLPGLLTGSPAVFRRVRFALGSSLYFFHEAAVPFTVVDAAGERLPVQIDGARIVTPALEWTHIPLDVFRPLVERIPDDLGGRIARKKTRFLAQRSPAGPFLGNELLIQPGDEVDVVGEKTRVPDFTVTERLHREMPTRAILRSGRALPLVISRVRS